MPTRAPQHRPSFLKSREEAERDRKRAIDAQRPGPRQRGYDSEWERGRAEYLAEHPYCSRFGCREPAVDVDHIKSIRDRPDLRLVRSNWRGYCRSHHSSRTAKEQGFARKR